MSALDQKMTENEYLYNIKLPNNKYVLSPCLDGVPTDPRSFFNFPQPPCSFRQDSHRLLQLRSHIFTSHVFLCVRHHIIQLIPLIQPYILHPFLNVEAKVYIRTCPEVALDGLVGTLGVCSDCSHRFCNRQRDHISDSTLFLETYRLNFARPDTDDASDALTRENQFCFLEDDVAGIILDHTTINIFPLDTLDIDDGALEKGRRCGGGTSGVDNGAVDGTLARCSV